MRATRQFDESFQCSLKGEPFTIDKDSVNYHLVEKNWEENRELYDMGTKREVKLIKNKPVKRRRGE